MLGKLKALRDTRDMSQHDVAKYLSISRQYYCFIENGQRRLSVDNAKKLGTLFGVDWPSFFEDAAAERSCGDV